MSQLSGVLGLSALTVIYLLLSLLKAGLRTLSKVVVRRMADEAEPPVKRLLESYLRQPLEFILNLQVLIQTALIGATLTVAALLESLSVVSALGLAFACCAGAVVLLEQLLPRLAAAGEPERLVSRLLRGYGLLEPLARLVTWPVSRLHAALTPTPSPQVEVSEEQIRAYLDVGAEEGIIRRDEGEILESVLEFSETVVREVMTPRIDMVCVEAGKSIAELRDLIIESKHSRIPVFRDRVDNIVGVVFLKDLLEAWRGGQESKSVVSLMRPAQFVPETMRVAQLLRELQLQRAQVAIVVDEYGGTSGLVTIEDLLEEIVGEITDEHEKPTPLVAQEQDGVYLISGKAEIEVVEELFDLDLARDDFDTLAGLVFATLGRVPSQGEQFETHGLAVEVVEADHRRVKTLRLRLSNPDQVSVSSGRPSEPEQPRD